MNTTTAAGAVAAIEFLNANEQRFNSLFVINNDAVDMDIFFDGDDSSRRRLRVHAGVGMTIQPNEGITFKYLVIKNLDGSAAMVAGKIYFRALRARILVG